eukprot:TRINITY_DN449_c0_g4_i1.p1 TRINITY_DN449_c0_g4~~TRINITY_DN449_c0_g4_i1.p1  ORF type:complete len:208 (+),score=57.96 TRINITY_DN449_c0_g4_i1:75-698(+)
MDCKSPSYTVRPNQLSRKQWYQRRVRGEMEMEEEEGVSSKLHLPKAPHKDLLCSTTVESSSETLLKKPRSRSVDSSLLSDSPFSIIEFTITNTLRSKYGGLPSSLFADVASLRREMEEIQGEIELLKKAYAIFCDNCFGSNLKLHLVETPDIRMFKKLLSSPYHRFNGENVTKVTINECGDEAKEENTSIMKIYSQPITLMQSLWPI